MRIYSIALLMFVSNLASAKTFHAASTNFHILTTPPPPPEKGEGILVDITRDVLKRMGHELVYNTYPWKRAIQKVASGEAEILLGAYKNKEREKTFLFSKYWAYQDIISVFTKRGTNIHWTGDLKQAGCKTLGVLLGWSYGDPIDGILKAQSTETFLEESKAFFLVARDRLDCFIVSNDVADNALQNSEDKKEIQKLTPPLTTLGVYFAFSKQVVDQKFVDSFEHEVLELEKDGTIAAIYKKYGRSLVKLKK